MNHDQALHGGCSCGRNKYIIVIPQDASERPQVFFSNSHSHRQSQATPLSAYLRIPLSWYQSSTYAFRADESHTAIRRVYTSPTEQSSKRHFCGFCGTPLSYWSEETPKEASYISLTLGSLAGGDLRDLEDLGVLPKEAVEEAEKDKENVKSVTAAGNGVGHEGLPWFESMVKGSRLGNVKTSWGERRSANGRYKVEWEVVEWTEDGDGAGATTAKRKIGEVVEDEDMEGTH